MLDSIKHIVIFKSVDKFIHEKNFEQALEKLNFLIKEGFRPAETFLKRANLCKKLMMYEEAYSDLTYVIHHCAYKNEAYYQRMLLNFELFNFVEAINDANFVIEIFKTNFEPTKIKILSLIYLEKTDAACDILNNVYEFNKYKILQFLFQEVAAVLSNDEINKALKLLDVIDIFDKDNPLKLLNEANIYGFIGKKPKQQEILDKIDSAFPKYFISKFRFVDMFVEKDLLELSFLLELKMFDKHNLFEYPMLIIEGYINHINGHILDSKECFEKAINVYPDKPDAYVLLAQTFQLMSGYDNPEYQKDALENYRIAMSIYQQNNLTEKVEEIKKQIRHLNSNLFC